jgi:hypothetical protein
MRALMLLVAGTVLAGAAGAGDVYVTRDAQGKPVYTDRPQTLPAEKLGIESASTDPVAVEEQYAERMQRYADESAAAQPAAQKKSSKAAAMTPEESARRCTEARQRHEAIMSSFRLYETAPNGERRYLTSEEIDTVRADAKKLTDELCSGQ